MEAQKEVLRPADLATLLGVTTGRVYQMISAGELPAMRMGRSIRIPRSAWEAWLTRRTADALAGLRLGQKETGTMTMRRRAVAHHA